MKIAILIGVDQYTDSRINLPACKSDVDLMEQVLHSTGEFESILSISENCTGNNIKDKITGFVSELKGNTIDEAFFYFTGHGDFYEHQFYYILSDFDTSKRKQTSLENNEVDNLLRSLQPKLTIKVVDACYSGISYIKGEKEINEHLEKSKNGFKDCYFMFSSNQNQASYQDDELSFFTRSFLKSLSKKDDQKIRYKDIIDFISDEFDRDTGQTPIFITQGAFTDIFCFSNSEIKKIIDPILYKSAGEDPENKSESVTTEMMTLEKVVQEGAKQYCDAEEVEDLLNSIKEHTLNFEYSIDIKPFFIFENKFQSHRYSEELLKEKVIGDWLSKNDEEYFAETVEEEIDYEVEVPDYSSIGMMRGGYRTKTKYRNSISGFKTTSNLSYDLVRIDAEPKFPNIPPYNCTLLIIVSKKSMLLFYYFAQYREKNWVERKLNSNIKWQYSKGSLKETDKTIDSVSKIQKDFGKFIFSSLQERFKFN